MYKKILIMILTSSMALSIDDIDILATFCRQFGKLLFVIIFCKIVIFTLTNAVRNLRQKAIFLYFFGYRLFSVVLLHMSVD